MAATATARVDRSRTRKRPRSSGRSRARNVRSRSTPAQSGALALPRLGLSGVGALSRRAIAFPDTGLITGIARGRKWIVVLAVLLFGIVALNVSLLKLNSEISSMATQSQKLSQQNARLRSKVVRLTTPERVLKAAEARGFVVPEPVQIKYLSRYPHPNTEQQKRIVSAAGFGGAR